MTFNEIATNIAEAAGRGTDHALKERIKFIFLQYRSLALRRMTGEVNPIYYQDLSCVETDLVDAAECCNVTVNCKVRKSRLPIPHPVTFRSYGYSYVGSIDNKQPYQHVDPAQLEYALRARYSASFPKWWQIGSYVYTNSKSRLLRIRAVFEDPRDASVFKTCDGAACYTDESEFPVGADIVATISESILKQVQGLANDESLEVPMVGTPATKPQ